MSDRAGPLRWMLWALGILMILFLVVYLVGARLPVDHTASAQRVIPASSDQVWRTLTEIERFASWRPGVERVVRLEDRNGLPAWQEEGDQGSLVFHTVFLEPPQRMIVRVTDPGGAFGGSWSYELTSTRNGTLVTLVEEGEIHSPLYRFFARFVFGYDASLQEYLDALEAELAASP